MMNQGENGVSGYDAINKIINLIKDKVTPETLREIYMAIDEYDTAVRKEVMAYARQQIFEQENF